MNLLIQIVNTLLNKHSSKCVSTLRMYLQNINKMSKIFLRLRTVIMFEKQIDQFLIQTDV